MPLDNPMTTQQLSFRGPRSIAAIVMDQVSQDELVTLRKIGVNLNERFVRDMMKAMSAGMDAQTALQTTGNLGTPVQFLQNWLPGFVAIVTAARMIDDLTGIMTAGSWEDEEIVQGVLEQTGTARVYGDVTNVNYAAWNQNYERRTIVRFEEGLFVGRLEEARAAKANISSAQQKRESCALSLNIVRNSVGFYGYNNGANRTYGFLNDPNLPAYVSSPGGAWSGLTYLQLQAAIRAGMASLQSGSKGVIDPVKTPITLAVGTAIAQYLYVTSDFGISVIDSLKSTYPQLRVVVAPELDAANASANVWYLYADTISGDNSTDGGRTWIQVVPSLFKSLGVESKTKGYEEDYSNATAGVLLKRGWAVRRYTGA